MVLSPRFFEHQVSIVYNPSIQPLLSFKITSSCTRSACGRRSPPWCSSERRRCCTPPRTPEVVFCILYSVLYILYSVLLYSVLCIFLVNRIKFRIFQYWDIVALPKFYFSSPIVSSSYSQSNRPAVSDQMPAGCLTWWEYHHSLDWRGSLWSTCHLHWQAFL